MMRASPLDWLLEAGNPEARYLTLRYLAHRSEGEREVRVARSALVRSAPVRAILDAQYPAGYWIKPDRGYSPKHKATTWQLVFLADLGVPRNAPIARACKHVMGSAFRADHGLFSAHEHSTGLFPCLNGDLVRALWHLDCGAHPTVRATISSLAERIIADGWICPKSGTRARDRSTWLPCLWGCVKVLRGFAAVPEDQRPPAVRRAIELGVGFLLSHDLTQDQGPALVEADAHWLRFGFPLGYGSDLLEALLALSELGVHDVRADDAVRIVLEKRDETGRWPLEHAVRSAWADFGAEGAPNKWVTLRALRVLEWFTA